MKKLYLDRNLSNKNLEGKQVSRRVFLRNTFAVGVLANLPLLQSCVGDEVSYSVLSKKDLKRVIAVQNILFPNDEHGPGAIDFNAQLYLLWFLQDKRIDTDEKDYIRNGITWVEETAQEEYDKAFLRLSKKEQVQLINFISKKSWGESWLSVMMNLIIEAMISDPIYGFNSEEIGWEWISHISGLPRPSADTKYDEIFATVLKNK